MTSPISEHKDRVVFQEGDRFRKEFDSTRARDEEVKRYRWLEKIGVLGPEILDTSGTMLVTKRLPGTALDELIATRWAKMTRSQRNDVIQRVAGACRRIRDGGFTWPDLVTYHFYVSESEVRVLDPPRLRKGRLDLSPLFWSAEEPTVTRTERLRFWRAYAGKAPPPRLRRIGSRGRFRPYRWVFQRGEIRPLPRWSGDFTKAIEVPFASADEVATSPRLRVRRELKDRTNAYLADLVVKITTDPREAEAEWVNHRALMASGFRVPQPAFGGVLRDGRGLFATLKLKSLHPMDDVWETLDPRRAVRAMADIARRLHACGLVHRDLYLCHLFVEKGEDRITLIDLARMVRTTSRRKRVKDLAALAMSADGLASRAQLWRGLKRYGGDKRLARAIVKKAKKMARHVPRNVRNGTHVAHVPGS
ncbi:MAG: lipopolysaccharide kinase InaA family protein [Planctomycetota bacterium]|jgi:tRNA A-37 threonylcarbamoyl transferase component Bud32